MRQHPNLLNPVEMPAQAVAPGRVIVLAMRWIVFVAVFSVLVGGIVIIASLVLAARYLLEVLVR